MTQKTKNVAFEKFLEYTTLKPLAGEAVIKLKIEICGNYLNFQHFLN